MRNETNNVGAGSVSTPKGISTRHKPFVRIGNATTGITLIALVITIIILLILAGITINLTIGQHGILNMAKGAGEEYQKAAARDKLELAISNLQATKLGDMKLVDLNDIEDANVKVLDIILEDDVEAYVEVDGKYQFAIDFDFNIRYIENGKAIEYVEGLFKMPVLTSDDCVIDGKRYIVTASSIYYSNDSFKIFTGVEKDESWCSNGGSNQWIQIQFPDAIKINTFTIKNNDFQPPSSISNFELLSSNDGENWTSLGNYNNNSENLAETSFNVETSDYYYYYKISCGDGFKSIGELVLNDAVIKISRKKILQIQNRISKIGNVTKDSYEELINIYKDYNCLTDEAKTLITNYNKLEDAINSYNNLNVLRVFTMPILTADDCVIDEKRYIVTASSVLDGGVLAYKIFDGNNSESCSEWHSNNGNNQWIQIQFPDKIKINSFTIKNRIMAPVYDISDFELLGSNDGKSWTSLGNYINNTGSLAETSFNVENSDFYCYYKIDCGNGYKTIGELVLNDALIKSIIDIK